MIKLDIGELLRSPGMNYHYNVQEKLTPSPELDYASPVVGYLDFHRTSNLLVLRGELEAAVRGECVRCLEEVILPIQTNVEEEFTVENLLVVGNPEEGEGGQIVRTLFDEQHFFLDEFIRQQLILAREEYPLCAPDCLGLCAQCGANQNEGACACVAVADDPRLARLAELYASPNGAAS